MKKNPKFLVESDRIANAYLGMRSINESSEGGAEFKLGDKLFLRGKPVTVVGFTSPSADNTTLHSVTVRNDATGMENTIRAKDFDKLSREPSGEDASDDPLYPRDIFTIEVHEVDDKGKYDAVSAMEYSKIYYTFEEAVEDAKKAYREYAGDGREIVVDVLCGEQESEDGDIYSEPQVLLTIDGKSSGKSFSESYDSETNEYEMDAEDYADEKLKKAIRVIRDVCEENGAEVKGLVDGDRIYAKVFVRVLDDRDRPPGVGFNMNHIMATGYGIEKELEKRGVHGLFAGGWTGNRGVYYLHKSNPIEESIQADPNEKHFVCILGKDGKWLIESGWEFREDAKERMSEMLEFGFGKDGIKILSKVSLGKFGLDPLDDSCWVTGVVTKDDIGESEEDDDELVDELGDGQFHIFDRGDDFPYVERYIAIMPDGWVFSISRDGGCAVYDDPYTYTTKVEMENEFEGKEITDSPELPREVLKGLRIISANYYEADGDMDAATEIEEFVGEKSPSAK